jgi:hypothetical protein
VVEDGVRRGVVLQDRQAELGGEALVERPAAGEVAVEQDIGPVGVARVENGDVPSSREINAAIAEAKQRESDERAAKARLDRRLSGKSADDQQRVRQAEERKRRDRERDQEQRWQEQEQAEEAAAAAVAMLTRHLGPDLPAFAKLLTRAEVCRFQAKLAAAVLSGPRGGS